MLHSQKRRLISRKAWKDEGNAQDRIDARSSQQGEKSSCGLSSISRNCDIVIYSRLPSTIEIQSRVAPECDTGSQAIDADVQPEGRLWNRVDKQREARGCGRTTSTHAGRKNPVYYRISSDSHIVQSRRHFAGDGELPDVKTTQRGAKMIAKSPEEHVAEIGNLHVPASEDTVERTAMQRVEFLNRTARLH